MMQRFERLNAFGRYATLQHPAVRESGISVEDRPTLSCADVTFVRPSGQGAGSAFAGGVRTTRPVQKTELDPAAALRDHYAMAFPFGSGAELVSPERLHEFRLQLDGRKILARAAFLEGARLGVAFDGLDGVVSLVTDAPIAANELLDFFSRSVTETETPAGSN
jgi:hypothetical protein